jgi:hypothetical protein
MNKEWQSEVISLQRNVFLSAARRFAVDVTQGPTIRKQVCELFSLFLVRTGGGGSVEGPVGEGCCAESRRLDQKFDQLQSVRSHFSLCVWTSAIFKTKPLKWNCG